LISIMNNFPSFRSVLGANGVGQVSHRIGGSGENRVSLPPAETLKLAGVMREAHWRTFGWVSASTSSAVPQWASDVDTAASQAMAIAVARGAPWVGADHLLEALLSDSTNAASHLLQHQKADFECLTETARRTWPIAGGKPPPRELAGSLSRVGVLVEPGQADRRRPTILSRSVAAAATRLAAQTTPVLAFLEQEATAETIRLGHDRTTLIHLVMAVLVLEDEMAATGLRPVSRYMPSCDFVLRPFSLDRELAAVTAAPIFSEATLTQPQRRRSWRTNPKNPPWTLAAARAAENARSVAGPGRSGPAGSAHLLYAALLDPDDSARRLLRDHAVDPAAVQDVLAARLGISDRSF
jgi:hypothetical protein